MIRTMLISGVMLGASVAPALAHDLRVFARVDGETVLVEAKFSNGRAPLLGEIALSDAEGEPIGTVPLDSGGETAFALPDGISETGMRIDVRVSEGHSEYWLLTPGDIARGKEEE